MRSLVILLLLTLLLTAPLLAQSTAGLRWTAPAGWKLEAPRPLRAATYTVPPATGDREPAECGIYFFGAGQGGSVEANLERWKDQIRSPGGQPAAARTAKRTISGLPVTTLDVAGDYSGAGGPLAAAPSSKPGYRLLGAIVEGPGGNVFIKFTGPAKTIAANQQRFEQMLASFQKDVGSRPK